MPRRADRVVRRVMADGTTREYRYPPQRSRVRYEADSLGALIVEYKRSPEWLALADNSRAMYTIYLRVLEADPTTPARDVRRRDILALRDAVAQERGGGAANGFLRAASALFGWAVDREWIDATPLHRVRSLPATPLPAWTAQDVRLAIQHLPPHLARVVFLAAATGQRRGDLLALRWADYDGAALRLTQQKTGAAMVLPLPLAARRALDSWPREAETILTDRRGKPWVGSYLSNALRTALAKIDGFPAGLNIHGVRKFKAAELASAGATVHQIAAVTGHRTLAMVEHYTRSADQERLAREALDKRPRQHRTISR